MWRTVAVTIRPALVLGALILVGCASRVPLTKALLREYSLSTADVKKLQLYVSDAVLLEQQDSSVNKNIDESYSLKKVEDQYVKRIVLRGSTPCIATEATADKLSVAFEPADALTFVADPTVRGIGFVYKPDTKLPEPVVEPRPSGSGFYGWKTVGTENYADSSYSVYIKRDMPILLVDQASLKNFVVESRTLPGMKQIDQGPGLEDK